MSFSQSQTSFPAPARTAPQYILPFLGGFYEHFAEPLAWVCFRVFVGLALVHESIPKVMAPFAQVGFVENLGFYPGWFWSPFLAYLQLVGGIAIAIGLLTRPFALACAVMLAITVYFHFTHPYGSAILSDAGKTFLASNGAAYLTPAGKMQLADDGGAGFLTLAQEKAYVLSIMWTGAAAFFAAFGGGTLSVDRNIIGREF